MAEFELSFFHLDALHRPVELLAASHLAWLAALLYCSINDPNAYTPEELNRASGIPELPYIAGTISLARSLIGTPGTLAVVADRTTAGQLNLERYRQPDPGHAVMMDHRRMRSYSVRPAQLPADALVLGAPCPWHQEVPPDDWWARVHPEDREQALHDALAERDNLLREVHHRVKNNFQIISSLLRLEAATLDAGPAITALQNANRRIFAMSLVHELLYQEDLSGAIELGHYLERLATALLGEVEGLQMSLSGQGDRLEIPLDTAIPLGLICNEALMNILRHAFPPEHRVDIRLERIAEAARLTIQDNGIGPGSARQVQSPEEKAKEGVLPSLGLTLMDALSSQIDGTWNIRHDGGTIVVLEFPLPG